jgi:ABC-2 type transport system ATP-binding protein
MHSRTPDEQEPGGQSPEGHGPEGTVPRLEAPDGRAPGGLTPAEQATVAGHLQPIAGSENRAQEVSEQRNRARTSGQNQGAAEHPAMIDVRGLRKHYRDSPEGTGLNGIDLLVPRGTVHGLLGPNGAGKTTAVRILTTLLRSDGGTARVAGYDIRTQGREVRRRIGLVGQSAAVDEVLTGRQNLVLVGRLNHLPPVASAERADELLQRFSLAEAAERKVGKYSGGMRRRLDLAAALVVAPDVLFVDEPTTGLDPQGRREVWSAIRELVSGGTTVLLTTQYLEEADQLADQITMLSAGRVVARGTPTELKAAIGGDWLDVTLADPADLPRLHELAAPFAGGDLRVDEHAAQLSIPVADRTKALVALSAALTRSGLDPLDIVVRRPTLDEVFLHLTATSSATTTPSEPGRDAVRWSTGTGQGAAQ